MLKDSNASVKQSKMILQLASLLKLLLLEKTWKGFGKPFGKVFQKPNWDPRVLLRIADHLDLWEHLGKVCNKLNASHCCGKLHHTQHMYVTSLSPFGKLMDSLCNDLHSFYL